MSSRVNLNDNVKERFEFTIGGLDYDFKYPTLEEIEPITEKHNQISVERAKNTPESLELAAKMDEEATELLYNLIIPVGHGVPIRETLSKQPFPVVQRFQKMLVEQLQAD